MFTYVCVLLSSLYLSISILLCICVSLWIIIHYQYRAADEQSWLSMFRGMFRIILGARNDFRCIASLRNKVCCLIFIRDLISRLYGVVALRGALCGQRSSRREWHRFVHVRAPFRPRGVHGHRRRALAAAQNAYASRISYACVPSCAPFYATSTQTNGRSFGFRFIHERFRVWFRRPLNVM